MANDNLEINVDVGNAIEQVKKLETEFKKFADQGFSSKQDFSTFEKLQKYFSSLETTLKSFPGAASAASSELKSIAASIAKLNSQKIEFKEFNKFATEIKNLSKAAGNGIADNNLSDYIEKTIKDLSKFKEQAGKDQNFAKLFNTTGVEQQVKDLEIYARKSRKALDLTGADKKSKTAFSKADFSQLDPEQVKEIRNLLSEFDRYKTIDVVKNPKEAVASIEKMEAMLTRIRSLSVNVAEAMKLAPESFRAELEKLKTNLEGAQTKGTSIANSNSRLNEYAQKKSFTPSIEVPDISYQDIKNQKIAQAEAIKAASSAISAQTVESAAQESAVQAGKKERANVEKTAAQTARENAKAEDRASKERIAQINANAAIERALAQERTAALRLEIARIRTASRGGTSAVNRNNQTSTQATGGGGSGAGGANSSVGAIGNAWSQTLAKLNQGIAVTGNNFKNMSGSAGLVNGVLSRAGALSNTFGAVIGKIGGVAFAGLGAALNGVLSTLSAGVGAAIRFSVALGGIVFAVSRIGAAFKSLDDVFKNAQVEYDQARSLLYAANEGNAEATKNDLIFVKGMANDIAVPVKSIITNYAKIKSAAMAAGGYTEAEVRKIVTSFSKAGKAAGLTQEQYKFAFRAIEQMIGKNGIAAEELRGQLSDSGLIGVQTALAKALYPAKSTSEAMKEMNKAMKEGKVSSEALIGMGNNLDKFSENALKFNENTLATSLTKLENQIESTKQYVLDNSDYSKSSVEAINTLSQGLENPAVKEFLIGVANFIGKAKVAFAEFVVAVIGGAIIVEEIIQQAMGSPTMNSLISIFKKTAAIFKAVWLAAVEDVRLSILKMQQAKAYLDGDQEKAQFIEAEMVMVRNDTVLAKKRAGMDLSFFRAEAAADAKDAEAAREKRKAELKKMETDNKAAYDQMKNDADKAGKNYDTKRGLKTGDKPGKGEKGLDSALREYNNAVLNADKKLNDELRNNQIEALKQQFEDGLISKQALIDEELKIRQKGLDEEISLVKERLGAANDALAKAVASKSEKDKLKAKSDIYSLEKDIEILMLKKGTLNFKAAVDTKKFKEDIEKAVGDANAQLLELQGNILAANLAKNKLELEQRLKDPTAREDAGLANTYRQISALKELKIQYDEIARQTDLKTAAMDRANKVIELTVQAGALTEEQAGLKKIQLLNAQIDLYQAQVDKLQQMNGLTEEQKVKIEEYKIKIMELKLQATSFYTDMGKAISGGLLDGVKQLLNHSVQIAGWWGKTAFILGNIANRILDNLIKKLETRIESNIFSFLTNEGKGGTAFTNFFSSIGGYFSDVPKYATGGIVFGAGNATSDSILARVSNGEAVLNAKAVSGIGASNFNYINKTGQLPINAVKQTQANVINNLTPSINLVVDDVASALRANASFNQHIIKTAMANRNKINRGS